MIVRNLFRLAGVGCLALFVTALYQHSQPALVASVVLTVLVIIGKFLSLSRASEQPDDTRDRAQAHLQPGETLQAVFTADPCEGPYLRGLFMLVVIALGTAVWTSGPTHTAGGGAGLGPRRRRWVIGATERSILIIKPSPDGDSVTRLSRYTQLGPLSCFWSMIWLDGEWLVVPRRFRREIELADQAILQAIGVGEPVLHWRRGRTGLSLRSRGSRRR